MSSSIVTHFSVHLDHHPADHTCQAAQASLCRNNDFVPDGSFHLRQQYLWVSLKPILNVAQDKSGVVGEKRGRCASRYLACAARKNARNLTVACTCRAPPSLLQERNRGHASFHSISSMFRSTIAWHTRFPHLTLHPFLHLHLVRLPLPRCFTCR